MANNSSLVPSGGLTNPIAIIGVGADIAARITSHLTEYLGSVVFASVEGIAISFEEAKVTIRVTRRRAQSSYIITAQEDIARRINNALNRAENSETLRLEIKAKLMDALLEDLDEIFYQLREELKRDREGF